MRTLLLLALALVAAFLIWILALRPDGSDAIAPDVAGVHGARAPAALHEESGVATPASRSDRAAPVVQADEGASATTRPTLILVHVTSVESGKPVEHMRINAWGEKTLLVLGSQALETDEEGFVEMEVEPGFTLIVNAQGDGRTTGNAQVRIEALKLGERREVALSVVTQPDLVIHGIVLQRETREAVAGVVVTPESYLPTESGARAVTGNDGRFRLDLRAFATAALRYEHAEFATALSPARAGHDRPEEALEILLDRAASIRAQVTAASGRDTSSWQLVATAQAADLVQPGDGWDIAVAPLHWSAKVGARLDRMPPRARLAVEVRDGTRVAWRSSQPIVLAPGEERVLECPVGSGILEGIVRDADGNPARDVEIAIVPAVLEGDRRILEPQEFDMKQTCLDDGSYRFESVPLGTWFVVPAIDRMASRHQYRDCVRLAERIEIRHDGDRVVHDIVLVRGQAIAGRVVDGNGNGVPLATVHGRHESMLGMVEVACEPDGDFFLLQLVPGTWTLGASAPWLSAVEGVRVPAGTMDVVLTLGAATRVVVEVRDELDSLIHGASVNISAAEGKGDLHGYKTDERGSVIHTDPVFASVHVAAHTTDGRFAALRDLVVVPGRDTRAVLRVERAGRARLRFDGPGTSAIVVVHDRRLVVHLGTIVSGDEVDIAGPLGEVEVLLTVDGRQHKRTIRLEREPSSTLVFDGGWK